MRWECFDTKHGIDWVNFWLVNIMYLDSEMIVLQMNNGSTKKLSFQTEEEALEIFDRLTARLRNGQADKKDRKRDEEGWKGPEDFGKAG